MFYILQHGAAWCRKSGVVHAHHAHASQRHCQACPVGAPTCPVPATRAGDSEVISAAADTLAGRAASPPRAAPVAEQLGHDGTQQLPQRAHVRRPGRCGGRGRAGAAGGRARPRRGADRGRCPARVAQLHDVRQPVAQHVQQRLRRRVEHLRAARPLGRLRAALLNCLCASLLVCLRATLLRTRQKAAVMWQGLGAQATRAPACEELRCT